HHTLQMFDGLNVHGKKKFRAFMSAKKKPGLLRAPSLPVIIVAIVSAPIVSRPIVVIGVRSTTVIAVPRAIMVTVVVGIGGCRGAESCGAAAKADRPVTAATRLRRRVDDSGCRKRGNGGESNSYLSHVRSFLA